MSVMCLLPFSCSLEEETRTEVEKKNYMNNAEEAKDVLLGVYRTNTLDAMYGYYLSILFNLGTDISQVEGSGNENFRIIPTNSFPTTQSEVQQTWAALYTGIYRANDFLERISNKIGSYTTFHMDNFRGKDAIEGIITLTDEPIESIVIATPFDKPGHFYYNQKINCLRASGWVKLGGEKFELTPDRFFAVLDWGRGVWTYHNTWYWSSASGELDGVPFGWNLGYGFGDTSAATENALFYNGTLHKLEHINFEIPIKDGSEDFLAPWRFTSSDGRFEMQFQPVLDRAACTDLKLLKSDQHQVFGKFSGAAVLDDGSVLSVRDFFGFAEKVENKW